MSNFPMQYRHQKQQSSSSGIPSGEFSTGLAEQNSARQTIPGPSAGGASCYFLGFSFICLNSHSRASAQSRLAVRGEISSTAAASSKESPPM